jgi:ribokinase
MIVVFGSINVDIVTRVERLPKAGETVQGPDYRTIPGGKGANQALAAARAGARTAMIGAVGNDGFRETALKLLAGGGVDLSGVAALDDTATGIATIAVDDGGENQIVVASGANFRVDAGAVEARLSAGDLLLMQHEIPAEALLAGAEAAKRKGARVVLNAAPALPVGEALARMLDVLVVNEHEAAVIGRAMAMPEAPEDFARAFGERFGAMVVVTLGAAGAIAVEGAEVTRATPPKVTVVDTTAAGDTFTGAFAAALSRGETTEAALRFGVAAGSLATTVAGAQPSIPTRDAVERLLG